MDEIRFVAASGALGSGVDEKSLMAALEMGPHFIASDAGTTDAGPFALGSGRPAFAREAVKHDLAAILRASRRAGIPALIGSVGTAGGNIQVDWMMEIVREVAVAQNLALKVAVIRCEQDPGYLSELYTQGRIRPLQPAPTIDAGIFRRSDHIVAMMGVEPLQDALQAGADLVIAGRCSDPALFAALPVMLGFPPGLAWHAGKIAECGTLACETSHAKGVIVGAIRHDQALIWPIGEGLRCTPQSIAAHSLYENADPYLHTECSGVLDLSESRYEAVDERTVRITGSAFHPASEYSMKLEGAELVGYQSLIIGGVRDPYIIRQLDRWLGGIKGYIHYKIAEVLGSRLTRSEYRLVFHLYGRNAVMGALEPEPAAAHEVGIVVEVTAPTQELATAIAQLCRQPLLHAPIPEWKGAITGFACLYNPAELERGPVWRFNLNHIAAPRDWRDMVRTEIVTMGEIAR